MFFVLFLFLFFHECVKYSNSLISTMCSYSKHFLPVSQFRPVNPFTQIHLNPFFWYKGMHLPVFLQGERSHMDCTKEGI